MEAEQRIQALEQEVQILKTQIQSILLDIQAHLLTNAYPALRGSNHTSGGASSEEEEDDDDEYDRAAPPPKVKKVSNGTAKAEKAASGTVKVEKASNGTAKAEKASKKAQAAVQPAEPVMASLAEQQEWVLEHIQSIGVSGTRDLIEGYTAKHRFSPEVSDALMRFTDMYAAAAEEQTLPSRPAGLMTASTVKSVNPSSGRAPKVKAQPVQPVQPVVQTVPSSVKTFTAEPRSKESSINASGIDENSNSSIVLRLIAGVQNAGAGVRWGKKE